MYAIPHFAFFFCFDAPKGGYVEGLSVADLLFCSELQYFFRNSKWGHLVHP